MVSTWLPLSRSFTRHPACPYDDLRLSVAEMLSIDLQVAVQAKLAACPEALAAGAVATLEAGSLAS
jgi:hypothetical protein